MGQYYKPILIDAQRQPVRWWYSHHLGSGLKITEHSYVGNEFVAAVLEALYYKACRLVWAGDYADEEGPFTKKNLYQLADEKTQVPKSRLLADPPKYNKAKYRYAVNYSKKQFVALNTQPYDSYGLRFCPLPLLTAEGNGRGGGDYEGSAMEYIGSWAGDEIKVVSRKADIGTGYEELVVEFKESD